MNVRLAYEVGGSGEPLVLVHGSWGDRHNWDAVIGPLQERFTVVRYDRRGHSESERPPGQGSIEEDVDDLESLLSHLSIDRAHIVGNSFGAAISLRFALRKPSACRSLFIHEPPLLGILPSGDPVLEAVQAKIRAVVARLETGDDAGGARQFVEEIGLGPGMWDRLPQSMRDTFIRNAPTWLDETREAGALSLPLERLPSLNVRTLVSEGTASPPFFHQVVELLVRGIPGATRATFEGAGHVPHVTHPAEYVQRLTDFLGQ